MTVHSLRRWRNKEPAMGQCLVFPGAPHIPRRCDEITDSQLLKQLMIVSEATSAPERLIPGDPGGARVTS